MTRHSTSTLAPPPPSPELAQSPAYCALPASIRALLLLIEIEIAEAGGPIATIDLDDASAATGMGKRALLAALTELSAAGFIIVSRSETLCTVAMSTAWRRA
jgi:hypothetical protein